MNEYTDYVILICVKVLKIFSKVHSKGLFKMDIPFSLFLRFVYSFLFIIFSDHRLQCVLFLSISFSLV